MIARIVVFLLIMAAIYIGYILIRRGFRQYFENADTEARERHKLEARRDGVVELERDPDTGVYKPNPPPGAGPGRGPEEPPGS
jgi:cytochrome c-type biogenesis protein CcmH/NrfG